MEDVGALLVQGGEVGADGGEALDPGVGAEGAGDLLLALGHAQAEAFQYLPLVALEADEALIGELAASPLVRDISLDHFNLTMLSDTLPVIGADWVQDQLGFDGAGYDIAVLDTGVQSDHPVLAANVAQDAAACSSSRYYSADISLCPDGPPLCTNAVGVPLANSACGVGAADLDKCDGRCGHGTHVAGIAAGNGQEIGVAPGAGIIPVNVFIGRDSDSDGNADGKPDLVGAYDSDIIRGLEYVLRLSGTRKIAAVNMSLGGGIYSTTAGCDAGEAPMKAAVDRLREAGIATVVAAGNDGSSSGISSPGCISTVISVGATYNNDRIASFSNNRLP